MVTPRVKQLLMLALVACFALQTYLVYADKEGPVTLTGPELVGAELWHAHNCQACHQLYGFGGFIGPDLTNISGRLGREALTNRLEQLLSEGSGQMPAFGLGAEEAAKISAFLVAMNQTGTGQLRAPVGEGLGWVEAVSQRVESSGSVGVIAGWAAYSARPCNACHRPFDEGTSGAPALAAIYSNLSQDEIDRVLVEGKAPMMPPPTPSFSKEEREAVAQFIEWIAREQASIEALMAPAPEFSFSDIPWYEYSEKEAG